MNNHQWVGHDLRGELGKGGTHIKLDNVNGHVEIHHAQDGHAMSPVKDGSHHDKEMMMTTARFSSAGILPAVARASRPRIW